MNTIVKQISRRLLQENGSTNFAATMCTIKGQYETLSVSVPKQFVYHVEINRPNKLNAMNRTMWMEFIKCFQELDTNPDCRAIILSATGRLFCAGIDLNDFASLAPQTDSDDATRKAKIMFPNIKLFQESFSSIEKCSKPVIASVHGGCVGAGVDMITAADMRHCTKDAYFQVKEVDVGMAADVGTLQRLPKVIGNDSLARELCFSARKLPAEEALKCGLVSKVYNDKDSMMAGVLELAETIASKSPVAVQLTKQSMVFSRDHTVAEGLDHIALINQYALQSEDLMIAAIAAANKQKDVVFAKL